MTGNRHAGAASTGGPRTPIIMAGRVVEVDPLRWTCRVRTEVLGKNLRDVQVTSPYAHPVGGEGVHTMPEVGALVYVCRPSDGEDAPWFIQSYRAYPSRSVSTSGNGNRPAADGNRPRMAPGDQAMVGRDRNGVFVRRGPLTEVVGGPLARVLYSGRTGTVHTLCQNLRVDAFGGSLSWAADRPEADPDGYRRTRADLRLKEFADDRAHVAQLEVGGGIEALQEGAPDGDAGVGGPSPDTLSSITAPVFRLRVFTDGDREVGDLSTAVVLAADKEGHLEVAARNDLLIQVRGAANCTVRVGADGAVEVTTDASITHTAAGLAVTHDGAKVSVGGGAAPVLVDAGYSSAAAAAWAEVVALAQALGLPSTAMAQLAASLSSGTYTAERLNTD